MSSTDPRVTRSIRLPAEVDRQLRLMADADLRSLNNMVEVLIVSERRRRDDGLRAKS